jgi:hypothetical protein
MLFFRKLSLENDSFLVWCHNGFKHFKSHPLRQFGNKWHEVEVFKKPVN